MEPYPRSTIGPSNLINTDEFFDKSIVLSWFALDVKIMKKARDASVRALNDGALGGIGALEYGGGRGRYFESSALEGALAAFNIGKKSGV